MSAIETCVKLIKEWHPEVLPAELKYRNSLIAFLRNRLSNVQMETEYRHGGTTIDIYVKQSAFFGPREIFIEIKRNLQHKAQLDRLVGQIESLTPKKSNIIVVLCGDTSPALLRRLKERYVNDVDDFLGLDRFAVIVKETAQSAKS
jgi:hypothetical protein